MDWEAYDRIMKKVKRHADACLNSPTFDPAAALFLCVLIENEKEIMALKRQIGVRTYEENMIE